MRTDIHYAPLMADENLNETFVLRMTKADRKLLDTLATQLPLKATQIARLALRIGLGEIERDPSCILRNDARRKR
jgi:hypothetical protein